MKKGKLIVIDGLDGTGKETQCELLKRYLESKGKKVKIQNFPDYKNRSSELVKMYLDGSFGSDPNMVNPYAVSSFYAIDRFISYNSSNSEWKSYLDLGKIVIADRYTTANLIYQSAKLPASEFRSFVDWSINYEYNLLKLPEPDIAIFLDLPVEYSQKLIINRKNKYNNEATKDIHESDEEFLKKVYVQAHKVADLLGWHKIKCIKDNQLKTISEISEDITNIIDMGLKF